MSHLSEKFNLQPSLRAAISVLAIVLVLMVVVTQAAQAQTLTVLHNFTGPDGAGPEAGLTMDRAGNLYGTARFGGYTGVACGPDGCGTVFKLSHKGSGWVFTPLYIFQGGDDGEYPQARVIIGASGDLYGATVMGGLFYGTVFNLKPPARACTTALCGWTKSVLYSFTGGTDGGYPAGDLVFDQAGDLYGTTSEGGPANDGVVYELTPSHGAWTETVPYSFPGGTSGAEPYSGVIFDSSGNIYGTTAFGGMGQLGGDGTVYKLTQSGSGWTESLLHDFMNTTDGWCPKGGLLFDESGNLFGATNGNGSGGTVFEMNFSDGNWTLTTIHSFDASFPGGPTATLAMDAAGNLYGTTPGGGAYGYGSVFKLTPSGGTWAYVDMYDFMGQSDGGYPYGGVTLDAHGNLYGTAGSGGTGNCYPSGCGVVWEITP